jgi:hypothetical protein
MQMSLVPLVVEGQSDPLVGRVRQALNVPGGLVLDRPLMELVRGVQQARGLTAHGELDEQTLSVFDISVL